MSIGMYTFKSLYGYDASTFIDHIFVDIIAPKAKDWIEESQEILKVLRELVGCSKSAKTICRST